MKIIIGLVFIIGLSTFCLSLFSTRELNEFTSDELDTVEIKSVSKKKIIEDFDDFNSEPSSSSSLGHTEKKLSSEDTSRDFAPVNLTIEQEAELQNNINIFKEINDKKYEIRVQVLEELEELERINTDTLECLTQEECVSLLKDSFFSLGRVINGPEMSFLLELDYIKKKQRFSYEEKIKKINNRFNSNN